MLGGLFRSERTMSKITTLLMACLLSLCFFTNMIFCNSTVNQKEIWEYFNKREKIICVGFFLRGMNEGVELTRDSIVNMFQDKNTLPPSEVFSGVIYVFAQINGTQNIKPTPIEEIIGYVDYFYSQKRNSDKRIGVAVWQAIDSNRKRIND